MPAFRFILLAMLMTLASCKGTRFYWESKLTMKHFSGADWHTLKTSFDLNSELSGWHPVFGKYCSGLNSRDAHLFVCWKKNELRIVSSYPGILKGDDAITTAHETLEKYLHAASSEPGYNTHIDIKSWILRKYSVSQHSDRLLTYGKGSFIIKDELSQGD
ncbi:MAG: hypothetical protein ACJ76H_07955 [Bacteriovoracaceae bacterium]